MVCTPKWHWKHQTKEYGIGCMYIYGVRVYNRCVIHHTKLIYFFHFFQICDIAYRIHNLRDMQWSGAEIARRKAFTLLSYWPVKLNQQHEFGHCERLHVKHVQKLLVSVFLSQWWHPQKISSTVYMGIALPSYDLWKRFMKLLQWNSSSS